MTDSQEFTVEAASAAAQRGDLGKWVAEFLSSPGSDNAPLAHALTEPARWWLGPVQVPLDRLNRLAGPADHPVLCPVDEDYWRDDVDDLEEKVEEGWEPPPMIVTYRDGELLLEDGNHRCEGLRRAGVPSAWSVIGFDDAEQRDRFDLASLETT